VVEEEVEHLLVLESGEEMENTMVKYIMQETALLKVVEVEGLYIIMMVVHGVHLLVMEVILLDGREVVEVVTAMVILKVVVLVEVVEAVVIDLTMHRMLEVVEVVWFSFHILVVLEEQMETTGVVQLFIYIMVVILYTHIVNYGTLRTGK
jgi:hypothetical protein